MMSKRSIFALIFSIIFFAVSLNASPLPEEEEAQQEDILQVEQLTNEHIDHIIGHQNDIKHQIGKDIYSQDSFIVKKGKQESIYTITRAGGGIHVHKSDIYERWALTQYILGSRTSYTAPRNITDNNQKTQIQSTFEKAIRARAALSHIDAKYLSRKNELLGKIKIAQDTIASQRDKINKTTDRIQRIEEQKKVNPHNRNIDTEIAKETSVLQGSNATIAENEALIKKLNTNIADITSSATAEHAALKQKLDAQVREIERGEGSLAKEKEYLKEYSDNIRTLNKKIATLDQSILQLKKEINGKEEMIQMQFSRNKSSVNLQKEKKMLENNLKEVESQKKTEQKKIDSYRKPNVQGLEDILTTLKETNVRSYFSHPDASGNVRGSSSIPSGVPMPAAPSSTSAPSSSAPTPAASSSGSATPTSATPLAPMPTIEPTTESTIASAPGKLAQSESSNGTDTRTDTDKPKLTTGSGIPVGSGGTKLQSRMDVSSSAPTATPSSGKGWFSWLFAGSSTPAASSSGSTTPTSATPLAPMPTIAPTTESTIASAPAKLAQSESSNGTDRTDTDKPKLTTGSGLGSGDTKPQMDVSSSAPTATMSSDEGSWSSWFSSFFGGSSTPAASSSGSARKGSSSSTNFSSSSGGIPVTHDGIQQGDNAQSGEKFTEGGKFTPNSHRTRSIDSGTVKSGGSGSKSSTVSGGSKSIKGRYREWNTHSKTRVSHTKRKNSTMSSSLRGSEALQNDSDVLDGNIALGE